MIVLVFVFYGQFNYFLVNIFQMMNKLFFIFVALLLGIILSLVQENWIKLYKNIIKVFGLNYVMLFDGVGDF